LRFGLREVLWDLPIENNTSPRISCHQLQGDRFQSVTAGQHTQRIVHAILNILIQRFRSIRWSVPPTEVFYIKLNVGEPSELCSREEANRRFICRLVVPEEEGWPNVGKRVAVKLEGPQWRMKKVVAFGIYSFANYENIGGSSMLSSCLGCLWEETEAIDQIPYFSRDVEQMLGLRIR
jgi:hypothetical protein